MLKGVGVVLLLVLCIGVAYAQPLKEWNEAAIQKYNNAKAEYLKIKGFYEDAREDWLTARNKYMQYKNSENLENALEKGKDYLLKADQTLVKYLEMISAYVEGEPSLSDTERENILNELDSYITWLEQKQPEIEDATTKKELVEIAETVRNKWMEIRPTTKRIVGQIMNAKVLWLINKAETASDKVDNTIEKLKEQGKDTTALEAWLEDFNTKIDLAKQKHQAAKEKYAEIKDVKDADELLRQGDEFVREANQYLKSAYKDLKEIVKELRKYRSGEVTVSGTGRLTAEGDGKAYLSGNATIEISGSGVLTVTDNYGDMEISVSGFGNKTEIEPNKWQYTGVGSAHIVGSDITVELEGQNIDLTAEGTGTATLTGTGTYEVCGKKCIQSEWSATGVSIEISASVE